MFKIRFSRDLLNRENPRKITGINITCGYHCGSHCWCDKGSKCKYRKGFVFHNWSVNVHNWFYWKFNIKLPHWIYIGKRYTDLSGTIKCPFRKSRRYTCYDCEYLYGERGCINKNYRNTSWEESRSNDPEWDSGKCKFFEKNSWADNWDKNTGERIF